MRELTESHNIIIFIDELHTLVGAGSAEGSLDAANILKPALSPRRDPVHRRHHARRVPQVHREGPLAGAPLPGGQGRLAHRGGDDPDPPRDQGPLREVPPRRATSDEALEAAVYQSSRYITDRFLPDKAIDLLDEAGSRVKLRDAAAHRGDAGVLAQDPRGGRPQRSRRADAPSSATRRSPSARTCRSCASTGTWAARAPTTSPRRDIDDVVSKWTGIPITAVKEEESAKLLRMEEELHKRIVSQENAISAVARAIRRTRAGLKNPHRPVGSFLFLGPTGVGKTEVARSLAAFLFGSERALIRFDMSEYMEKHSVSQAHRLAARLRRPRGGRPAHRAREAQPLLGGAARRDREGPPRRLQRAAAGVRGRPPHGRPRQHHRLQEHHPHHDLQHRGPLHREEGPHGLRLQRRQGHRRAASTRW